MSTTTTYPFTTAGNYTASDSTIAVTGGVGTLVDQRESNELFASLYTSSLDATRSTGTGTATAFGSVTVSNGAAIIVGDVNITYPAASNFVSPQSTVRFAVTPQYSGSPAATQIYFNYSVGTTNNNRIVLQQATNGNLEIGVYNSSGTALASGAYAWSPVSGTTYEIELDIDSTGADVYVFLEGTNILTLTNIAGWSLPSPTTEVLRWGRVSSAAQNYHLQWAVVFSGIKHTTAYTPIGAPPATLYATTNPTLLTNTSITGNISNVTATEVVSGSDLVKYAVQVSGTDKYWTGSAWATSSGYSQTNILADVAANIALLDTGNSAVKMKIYLHSEDGTTTPTIDDLVLTYDASDTSATEPQFCYLEGWLYDFNGPISGQLIEVRPFAGFTNSEIFLSHDWQTFDTTAADGYFSGRIWESASVGGYWEFRIGRKRYKVQVPNATSAKWSDLTITAVTS